MRRANKVFNVLMAAILSLSLMPAGSAFAADNGTGSSGTAAKPANVSVSNQIIILDGKEINTQGYSIDGSIYFKLRDAAELLKGTSVQFSVDFDEKSFQVRTKAGEAYSGSASVTEGTKADKPFSCSISKWALLVNGTQVGASIYNIDKSNYIRLSDLGALFGFGVKYDEMTKTTTLDTKAGYSLNISDYSNMWTYNADSNSYSLTGVTYCSDPAAAAYESLNIYVPAAYMNANGSITSKVINGYTAGTAPIIYSNGVGGYSQATAEALNKNSRSYNSFCTYLKNGYVVVSAGSRGKQTQASDGSFIGKSPAGLVDLKAGVRFLKYNDALLAGDSKKIVSIGTSAGGALSSLLGTTGNSPDYDSYLKEIGAVMTEGDDVYGAQCYCPIT
ncbi:MAG: hypothetical protein HGA22_13180, partial [Clostridiales bacterium]|nr:hypothetical protein [Clostridiales bacterium]